MNIYKRLLQYVPEKKWNLPIATILVGISAILLSLISYNIYLFTKALLNHDLATCKAIGTQVLWMLAIGSLTYYIAALVTHDLAFRLETNLKKVGIDCISKASAKFFDQTNSGVLRKTIDDNTQLTHTAVAHLIPDGTRLTISLILLYVIGFYANLKLGFFLIVLTILNGFIMMKMSGNQTFMKQYMKAMDDMSNEAVEYVRGLPVIKIFNSSITSFEAFYKTIEDYSKLALDYTMSCRNWFILFQLTFFVSPALLCMYAIYAYNKGIDPTEVISLLVLATILIGSLFVLFMSVMYTGMHVAQASTCLDKLEALYKSMEQEEIKHGEVETFDDYNIHFDHVSFGYKKDDLILNDLSFDLKENKIYALVGRSGSGKSTIAKLLAGLYQVDEGEIRIGSTNLLDYKESSLNSQIAFVFQDAKLFETSIYENVQIGNPKATHEEVMQALHLAMCDPILEKLPNKEETIIGAKGVYLSGGEKQRIAIARAILKDAKIVILDEASAATDPECEYEILQAFKNLMQNKTVLMIAHRLTTIKGVDEILVIDHGAIVERGDDTTLMNQKGLYYKLQTLYATANDWRVVHD